MIARLIEKGKQCEFGLKNGCCGKQAVVSVGYTRLCLEHFEYAVDLQPMDFQIGSEPIPPSRRQKTVPATRKEFLALAREWDATE